MTKEELLEEINKVKNATEKGENTALRIGSILENLAELCLDKDDSCVYVCVSDTVTVWEDEGDVFYTHKLLVTDPENLEMNRKAYDLIKRKLENKEGVVPILSTTEVNKKLGELNSLQYSGFVCTICKHVQSAILADINNDGLKDYLPEYKEIVSQNIGKEMIELWEDCDTPNCYLLMSSGDIVYFKVID